VILELPMSLACNPEDFLKTYSSNRGKEEQNPDKSMIGSKDAQKNNKKSK